MSYKTIKFLSEQETKLLVMLKENVKERYAVLAKIRLSEFLYSTQPEGSKAFYDEFQAVNQVVIPFALFDTLENRLAAVVYLADNGLEAQNLLEQHGTVCVSIISLKDALVSPLLDEFMQ